MSTGTHQYVVIIHTTPHPAHTSISSCKTLLTSYTAPHQIPSISPCKISLPTRHHIRYHLSHPASRNYLHCTISDAIYLTLQAITSYTAPHQIPPISPCKILLPTRHHMRFHLSHPARYYYFHFTTSDTIYLTLQDITTYTSPHQIPSISPYKP